ncbi:RsmB/NOP family class I SAM-dependent RNA methyltransferase [Natronohydrobacter thiooxidans]|uniref:RsmB/NOP family class I SAM-dependent RNA methyltransferase n=1 Tax=Natronohydrobacter thiooxidans TaxID=87172 RepID=UPI0008FF2A66|nr:RsmB/NOP family class I SAM-dependent RNA methyltransferase [Natronohydrobacter thiooxidans]
MTPAARHQAAIEILDRILGGAPAEQALTGWARGARYAGAKDRAAIRDLVFDVLRCKRSCAHLGGSMTGRGLILGLLRSAGQEAGAIFTGQTHAPPPLTAEEAAYQPPPLPEPVALDCPDWLMPAFTASLGDDHVAVLQALRQRAPVFLRVNLARIGRDAAMARLAEEGIATRPHPLAPSALEVIGNARGVQRSGAYAEGLVELQDAASQAVIADLPALEGLRVLDYCAGGGGKSLAMAALGAQVTAHDANPARMRDLPARAARAGVTVPMLAAPAGQFDLVLCDVPCSGSGSWRRAPGGKWGLTPERLAQLRQIQRAILDQVAPRVRPGGWLAYVTCSLFALENQAQIADFAARHAEFSLQSSRSLTPLEGGDGFYLALLRRDA